MKYWMCATSESVLGAREGDALLSFTLENCACSGVALYGGAELNVAFLPDFLPELGAR